MVLGFVLAGNLFLAKLNYLSFGMRFDKADAISVTASEMPGSFAGISNETIDLAASYLDGWLSVLKKDKKMILVAALKRKRHQIIS